MTMISEACTVSENRHRVKLKLFIIQYPQEYVKQLLHSSQKLNLIDFIVLNR